MVELPDVLDLTAPQTRVLGCLLEKSLTTPDAYPLTLKALTTACNQSSNRDPVVEYAEQLVETTALALKAKGLVRVVHPARGERATKYRHVADEALGLGSDALAVISVLCLRGAQTVAELRARTERLHTFGSPTEVEGTLRELADGERTFVVRLERGSGQKEDRWLQLLEADPQRRIETAAAAGAGGSGGPRRARAEPGALEQLAERVAALERRLDALSEELGVDTTSPADDD